MRVTIDFSTSETHSSDFLVNHLTVMPSTVKSDIHEHLGYCRDHCRDQSSKCSTDVRKLCNWNLNADTRYWPQIHLEMMLFWSTNTPFVCLGKIGCITCMDITQCFTRYFYPTKTIFMQASTYWFSVCPAIPAAPTVPFSPYKRFKNMSSNTFSLHSFITLTSARRV